jgi:rhodanese-related sulfurtransferase
MGYKNVYEYNEGLPEWKKRGLPMETASLYPVLKIASVSGPELRLLIEKKENIFIIDIRDEEDRKIGFVGGSAHIDMELLNENIAKLPRDKKIVLIDLHGKQASLAARFLVKNGFGNIAMLDKGFYGGWLKAGLPVSK